MDAPVQSSVVYADLLRASLSRNAPRQCFHVKRNGEWQSWTYADFGRDLNRCTDALKKAGFGGGDKGVVIGENCPEWVIAYHAFFCAGGYTVPVDPNLPAAEIGEIIRLSQAGFVVCSSSLLTVIEELRRGLPCIQKIIILNGIATRAMESFNDFCMTGVESAEALAGPFLADDPTALLFTSGTTGKAKGVVLTQRNFVSAPLHGVPRMKVSREDTMLAVLPLHHVFGAAANIAAALCTGMDLVFVTSIKGPLILEAMREKGVTILPAVPKMVALFYNAIEHKVRSKGMLAMIFFRILFFLSMTLGPVFGSTLRKKLFASVHATFGGRLNLIISGGASLGKKYLIGFLRMGFTIVEGYGLTETFGPITLCPSSAPRLGSVGTILPDNDIKIREPDARGVGEVLLRGACVFNGYYKSEQQTRAAFDAEGWFYTGDLGYIDRHGYLFLSGRIKDVIILDSGKNAYPDELEDFYGVSALIEEIGVFGATIQGKEIIAALIVASAAVTKTFGTDKTPEVIHSEIVRMGRNLPSYKKLTDYLVVAGPLPKTTTQKLKKHELRQLYFAARDTTGKIRPPLGVQSAMDAA
ncbi:MAG TPA: AMP-binding protein, partial [Chitinivibrionales bacterium]